EQSLLAVLDRLAVALVHDVRLDPGERMGRRARLGRRQTRERRDHDLARLGLPPGVDDRAALTADNRVVPQPGLRVDRLADGSEQPQLVQIVLLDMFGPPLDTRAN